MTPIRPGRGGWGSSTAGVLRLTALALICLSLGAAAGCASKKKPPGPGEGGAGLGNTSVNEGTVGASQGGSLFGGGTGGPLHDIHFGYNDYTIEQQDSSVLRDNATWLNGHPGTQVQIEGHCDERGSEEYNIALGAKRAQSAKDYLVTLGISGSRISTISYGKELPVCQEHDETCWQMNRRDHFVVSSGGASAPPPQ